MAVYKADILDIELNTGNIARSFLCHNIGKDDTKADRFGVRVYRDGEPESLSGCSIQGYMMRPNGTNLAITGSNTGVSGNEAWVDLPQAAYDYEGQFCLALKLIGGGVTGTIRIIDGMINNTFVDDALVPMQSVPTYQEILAVYDQMVAAKNGSVRFDQSQSLTETQKSVARMNIDAARDSDVSDLKSALTQIDTVLTADDFVWSRGAIRANDGTNNNTAGLLKTRIRTEQIPYGEYSITRFNDTMLFVFYYNSSFLGFKNVESNSIVISDYYPEATTFRLMLLKNPETQIGDGTGTDFSDVLTHIVVTKGKVYDEIESIKVLAESTDEKVEYLETSVDTLANFFVTDLGWTRGSIVTSSGANDNGHKTTRIRTELIDHNIIITKESDTMLLAFFYKDGVYTTWHNFNSKASFSVIGYIQQNSIDANGVRFVLLKNPETQIGDGAGTDYSDVLGLISFATKPTSRYKKYASGFQFFTVNVNNATPITTGDENEVKDTENYNAVTCMLKMPESYTPDGVPTKLLMMCHGAGRGMVGTNNWTTQTGYNNIVNAFLAAGYLVFDCQGYEDTSNGHTFWGAKKGVEAWRKAYEYVIENYNVEHNFCIYGFSMGGLTALGLAFDDFPNIKAIALASPVLDLTKCISESTFQAAYGLESAVYDESSCRGCNPMGHLLEINSEDMVLAKLPPLKIWYGGNETNTAQPYVEKTYAQKFVNAITNGGGYAIYREVVGVGHEICYGLVPNAITEYVMFLNRYR